MPPTQVAVYRDRNGDCPMVDWLCELETKRPKAFAQCAARIALLRRFGSELRRPVSDYLRDGIRELRCRDGRVQYRILYSFIGQNVALLTHGITKEGEVPAREIEQAIRFVADVRRDESTYTLPFPENNDA